MPSSPISDHQLFYGLWRQDLEPLLISTLKAIKDKDLLDPVVVLVGSNLLREYLEWRLVEAGLSCINIHIITLRQLAGDIGRPMDGLTLPESPPALSLAAVINAINSSSDLDYYEDIKHRPGFLNALVGTFTDLDEAGLHSDLPRITDRELYRKLTPLSTLRHNYCETTAKFQHPSDSLRSTNDLSSNFLTTYGTDILHCYGLYDFNELQWKFLVKLSKNTTFKVFFPYLKPGDDWGSSYSYADPTFSSFSNLVGTERVQSVGTDSGPSRYLFRFNPDESSAELLQRELQIKLHCSQDRTDEIKTIVGMINQLVISDKVPLNEIGVLFWHPRLYLNSFTHVFNDSGIPYYDSIGSNLTETAESRALVDLLSLKPHEIERSTLMDIVATHDLSVTIDGVKLAFDDAQWEYLSIESGIVKGDAVSWLRAMDLLEKRISKNAHSYSEWITLQGIASLKVFLKTLFDLTGKLSGKHSWEYFAKLADEFSTTFIPGSENRARIMKLLTDIMQLDHIGSMIGIDDFIRTLSRGLAEIHATSGHYKADGVTLCDKLSARGLNFRILIIPGMLQGEVPSISSGDPILTDGDRRRLNKSLTGDEASPLPLKEMRTPEERMIFGMAADSAREQLILTWPEQSDSGTQTSPSRYVIDLCRIFTGRSIASDHLNRLPFYRDYRQEKSQDDLIQQSFDENSLKIDWIAASTEPRLRMKAVEAVTDTAHDGLSVHQERMTGDTYTEWDGAVNRTTTPIKEVSFSVTEIEGYALCPFKYFIRHKLNSRPWEEPEKLIEIPPYAIGSIIHKVLERVYQPSVGCMTTVELSEHLTQSVESVGQLLREVIDEYRWRWPLPDVIWEVESDSMRARLKKFLTQQRETLGEYTCMEVESDVVYALEVEHDRDKVQVKLKGRIDRIDISNDGRSARIIDYKTGNLKWKKDRFEGGKALQLPIYLSAVSASINAVELTESSASYLQIKPTGDARTVAFSGAILQQRQADFESILQTIIKGILSDFYPPIPEDAVCERCEAAPVCDRRSRASSARRHGDERVQSLLRMRDVE